ncbi:exodeoxyribonuclease VII large subunit [Jeotgalibaca sp. A122]|uniref:exodeoxyribonuclease VII large subunit n=1 Tax=Jeotgalibaca sp. A122 TaxID=3457322 RepID=UPI003FD2175E
MSTQQYLTVTALTKYIKRKFDADPYLERVFLTGEVSNYRKRPNHQYFSIKDDNSVIAAVMYRGEFNRLKFKLEDGMKVLVIGRVNVYEPSGSYNIVVEHMEPDGIGALYQAYSELKERLSKEGLFSRPKKTLPKYPKKIAIVTSQSGAVIKDIMTTIKRRYPIVQLVLYPTVVQGKDSAQSIVTNLKRINETEDFDLAIIGRGGGSIEDLWSFNEEAVIRQIVAMNIPIISSVGHETDTTLSDLAADVRAATPTAAAELSVPVLAEVLLSIQKEEQRLYQVMRNKVAIGSEKLNRLMHSYVFRQPKRLYEGHLMRVDQLTSNLQTVAMKMMEQQTHNHHRLELQLRNVNPLNQVRILIETWKNADEDLHETMLRYMDKQKQELSQKMVSLDMLSPLKIMNRGYAYIQDENGILKSVDDAKLNQTVEIHLLDGNLKAKIIEIKENEHD